MKRSDIISFIKLSVKPIHRFLAWVGSSQVVENIIS